MEVVHRRCEMSELWRDPYGVAAMLDDRRDELAAKPHKASETDSPNKHGEVGRQQQQHFMKGILFICLSFSHNIGCCIFLQRFYYDEIATLAP